MEIIAIFEISLLGEKGKQRSNYANDRHAKVFRALLPGEDNVQYGGKGKPTWICLI